MKSVTDQDIYDGMIRLFLASMPKASIPATHVSLLMNFPINAMKHLLETLPLPSHVKIEVGGHRGHTVFFKADERPIARRIEDVEKIRAENMWDVRGLLLASSEMIVQQTEKVVSNISQIKGNLDQIAGKIEKGSPNTWRLQWFYKDISTAEFYPTIREALGARVRRQPTPSKKAIPEEIAAVPKRETETPKADVSSGPSLPSYPSLRNMPPPGFTLRALIYDVSQLIGAEDRWLEEKKHYERIIEELTTKIDSSYGAIVARKESENAELRRRLDKSIESNKEMEKKIKDLEERMTALAGYVAKKGKDTAGVVRRAG